MDEIVSLLESILSELTELNSKIDDIKGFGLNTSIQDICDKLDDVQSSVQEITANGVYTLQDVSNKLDTIDMTISMKDI